MRATRCATDGMRRKGEGRLARDQLAPLGAGRGWGGRDGRRNGRMGGVPVSWILNHSDFLDFLERVGQGPVEIGEEHPDRTGLAGGGVGHFLDKKEDASENGGNFITKN